MYDFYIKNYTNPDGTLVQAEQLLYSIPINNELKAVTDPSIKTEMGKAGALEFSMRVGHMYYNGLNQMKTIFRVVYDGTNIFRGRVLTIDTSPITGEKKVHCEGDLAFLLDSQREGIKEANRKERDILSYLQEVIYEHNLQMSESGSDDKSFTLGEVPGQYTSRISKDQRVVCDKRKYGSNSWESTMSALETLQKEFGGFFRTRYAPFDDTIGQFGEGNIDLNNRQVVHNDDGSISTEKSFSVKINDKEVLLPTIVNGQVISEDAAINHYNTTGEYLGKFDTVAEAEEYAQVLHLRQEWYYSGHSNKPKPWLDWIDNWYNDSQNPQTIEVGENVIDLRSSTEVDNIFTALIPIGSNNGKNIYLNDYKTDIHGPVKRILVPQIVSQFKTSELNRGFHKKSDYEEAVNRYGIITKVQQFQNANTKEKLWEYALDWIRNNYAGGITSIDLTALDMHHLNGEVCKYLAGDRVTIKYPDWNTSEHKRTVITRKMALTQVTYYPHHPEKNTYGAGIPNSLVSKTYGTSNQKKSTTKRGKDDVDDDLKEAGYDQELGDIEMSAWQFVINERYNSELYHKYVDKDNEDGHLDDAPGLLRALKNVLVKVIKTDAGPEAIPTLIADGERGRLSAVDERVLEHVIQDPELRKKVIEQSDEYHDVFGTMLINILEHYFTVNGKQPMSEEEISTGIEEVLSGLPEGATEQDKSDAVSQFLSGIGASPEVISAAAKLTDGGLNFGELNLGNDNTDSNVKLTSENEGAASVGRNSMGEWQVKLNNLVEYIDKDGNPQRKSGFVSAKDFNIDEIPSFKTKLAVVDQLIADKASINELEALQARISTLEADTAKIKELESDIARIDLVNVKGISVSGSLIFNNQGVHWTSLGIVRDISHTPPALVATDNYTFVTKDGKEVTGKLVSSFSPGTFVPISMNFRFLGAADM